jgi:GNAT superfamily N-acetyltransferase
VRAAARSTAPFAVGLDPPATFAPVSPTVHLPVVDDGRLIGLHRTLFRRPLWRDTHPYVAHLSLVATATAEQIAGSVSLLAGYRAELAVERLTVLIRTDRPRRWRTLTDVDLDGVRTVGGGLLAVELVAGTALEPAARALVDAEQALPPLEHTDATDSALAITAYREGAAVGAALGSPDTDAPTVVVVAPDARRQGLGRLLRQEWHFRADQRRATPTIPPA